jgi:hypothetical protein
VDQRRRGLVLRDGLSGLLKDRATSRVSKDEVASPTGANPSGSAPPLVSFMQQSIKNSIVQFEAFPTKLLDDFLQKQRQIYKISKLQHFTLTVFCALQYSN